MREAVLESAHRSRAGSLRVGPAGAGGGPSPLPPRRARGESAGGLELVKAVFNVPKGPPPSNLLAEFDEDVAQALKDTTLLSAEDPEQFFELNEKLGTGAHGAVYLAVNRITGEHLAVKKMRPLSAAAAKEILNEISILMSLDSPHCVRYHQTYLKDGFLWLAMEYMDCGSIGDQLAYSRDTDLLATPLSEPQVAVVLGQVCRALAYLHENNMVHRDLKGENILLHSDGSVKLADFGIAAELRADAGRTTQIGTPYWMAPEIIIGQSYDSSVDIWSLGIVCLDLCEPRHPFFKQSPVSALYSIASKPPPELEKKTHSPALRQFLSDCLCKDPKARPKSRLLLHHPFIAAHLPNSKKIILQLCKQYAGIKGNVTSTLAITGKTEFEDVDQEGVLKFMMADGTYRTLLAKTNETTADLIDRLRKKLGFLMQPHSQFAIYVSVSENERKMLPDECPVSLMLSSSKKTRFAFRELPNEVAFSDITKVSRRLCVDMEDIYESQELRKDALDVLLEPSVSVISASCWLPGVRSDQFFKHLLNIFCHGGRLFELFQVVGRKDLASTVSITDLFLASSVAGKLVSAYNKFAGMEYLRHVLAEPLESLKSLSDLRDIAESPPQHSTMLAYSASLVKAGLVEPGLRELSEVASNILDRILQSTDALPISFRIIMKELSQLTERCFLFSGLSPFVVERFFLFSKFILPAIASPYRFGLLPREPVAWESRVHLLLSKVVKAAVLGGRLGERDAFLQIFTKDLHRVYKDKFEAFLHNLTAVPAEPLPAAVGLSEDEVAESLEWMVRFCHEHLMDIGYRMGVLPEPPCIETNSVPSRRVEVPLRKSRKNQKKWNSLPRKVSILISSSAEKARRRLTGIDFGRKPSGGGGGGSGGGRRRSGEFEIVEEDEAATGESQVNEKAEASETD